MSGIFSELRKFTTARWVGVPRLRNVPYTLSWRTSWRVTEAVVVGLYMSSRYLKTILRP